MVWKDAILTFFFSLFKKERKVSREVKRPERLKETKSKQGGSGDVIPRLRESRLVEDKLGPALT
jgi:hypothetical protein